MRDLNNLSLFAAVVANGGFSAAARVVGTPKSRISRRVTALEDQLGVRLLERSSRHVKVTAVGHEVYKHARAALAEAEAIDHTISELKAEPQGLVRVSAPPGIDHVLGAALPTFLHRHPKLRLQIVVTNRRVDLIEEGIDIAVRIRDRLDSDADLQVKTLGQIGALLVASSKFVAEHGAPQFPSDLAKFATISVAERAGSERVVVIHESGTVAEIVHEPRFSVSALATVRHAVLNGAGIAMLPEYACRDMIDSGELVRILPAWTVPQEILHLVFTSRRGLRLGVRAVIDFLAGCLSPRSSISRPTSVSGKLAPLSKVPQKCL